MSAQARLRDLERRYDGPIPPAELDAARGLNVPLIEARGNTRFYREMAFRQIRTIRERRADGSFYPALIDDLRLYCREWRRARRRVAELSR